MEDMTVNALGDVVVNRCNSKNMVEVNHLKQYGHALGGHLSFR